MRDLDELVAAMRQQTDALPAAPLIPAIRRRAQVTRARRRIAAGTVIVLIVGLVGGVAALRGQRNTIAASTGTPDTDPAHLIGTWFLESWTNGAGNSARPNTGRVATLEFTSNTTASSYDTVNDTSWTLQLGNGNLVGIAGDTSAVAEPPGAQAVDEAVHQVLNGHATWQIRGSSLVIRGAGGSLTYTKDKAAAHALGGVIVYIHARAYQPYPISGSVVLTRSGAPAISGQVDDAAGLQLSGLTPGQYRVRAIVKGAICTPLTVDVSGGENASLDIACLLDRQEQPSPAPSKVQTSAPSNGPT